MTASAFSIMRAEVGARPSIFAQDPIYRSPAYAKWLGSAAYRKHAGTSTEAREWRRFRDNEIKGGVGHVRRRPSPSSNTPQLTGLSQRSSK